MVTRTLFLQKGRIVLLSGRNFWPFWPENVEKSWQHCFLTGPAFLGKEQCDEAGTGQAGHWGPASPLQVSVLTSRGIFYLFFHYFIQHCFIRIHCVGCLWD
jgi:hypothetical protein